MYKIAKCPLRYLINAVDRQGDREVRDIPPGFDRQAGPVGVGCRCSAQGGGGPLMRRSRRTGRRVRGGRERQARRQTRGAWECLPEPRMSAMGQKQTSAMLEVTSALRPKADIADFDAPTG